MSPPRVSSVHRPLPHSITRTTTTGVVIATYQPAETAGAITVDLSDVSYCDSAAVRALFSVAANTKLNLVVRAGAPIRTLLSVSGLDRIATVSMSDQQT